MSLILLFRRASEDNKDDVDDDCDHGMVEKITTEIDCLCSLSDYLLLLLFLKITSQNVSEDNSNAV